MTKILAFGASSSRRSINKAFATYAANKIEGADAKVVDLNDFEMPLYSVDVEQASGIPEHAVAFVNEVEHVDGLVVSLAEHNGSYSVAFKNLLDWSTRHKKDIWSEKPMFLLSTSPGARGGATVLEAAEKTFPHLGGNVVATFALPSFQDNFSENDGIVNKPLEEIFDDALSLFVKALNA